MKLSSSISYWMHHKLSHVTLRENVLSTKYSRHHKLLNDRMLSFNIECHLMQEPDYSSLAARLRDLPKLGSKGALDQESTLWGQ